MKWIRVIGVIGLAALLGTGVIGCDSDGTVAPEFEQHSQVENIAPQAARTAAADDVTSTPSTQVADVSSAPWTEDDDTSSSARVKDKSWSEIQGIYGSREGQSSLARVKDTTWSGIKNQYGQ